MMKCTYDSKTKKCKNRFSKIKYVCESCSFYKESNPIKRFFKWLGRVVEGMNEDIHNGGCE